LAPVTGSGAEYSVEVNTITGDGSMFPNVYTSGTDIADAANNHLSGGFNNSMGYIFDHTAPSVQSINRFDPSTEATTATTLVYRVAFSEPVSGVDKSDFALAATSPSTGTIASLAVVPGSWEREYDVTVHVTNGGGRHLAPRHEQQRYGHRR
jgi:hypothetical protein